MTDPVILLGTQSNGETLPVQVDGFGRLVAEGLPGPEGPEGPSGGSFPLPADPYEGALLGWLNGELSWVGTPPVPIPPGVFGPITAWDAESGLLTVEGEIPAAVGSGVYVWQCNQDGTYFTEGWNTSQIWSVGTTGTDVSNPSKAFDAVLSQSSSDAARAEMTVSNPGELVFNLSEFTETVTSLEVWTYNDPTNNSAVRRIDAGGTVYTIPKLQSERYNYEALTGAQLPPAGNLTTLKVTGSGVNGGVLVGGIKVNGNILVDNDLSLNFRVNSVLGQSLLGIPSATVDFTIGKYLRVPEQRVAPWVLYGNDPTSLIDHLRSS